MNEDVSGFQISSSRMGVGLHIDWYMMLVMLLSEEYTNFELIIDNFEECVTCMYKLAG